MATYMSLANTNFHLYKPLGFSKRVNFAQDRVDDWQSNRNQADKKFFM